MNKKRVSLVGIAALAVIAVGTTTVVADLGEGGGPQDPAPPGTPEVSPSGEELTESFDVPETITTTGTTYDPTILTKFIGGRGFVVNQGSGIELDTVLFDGQTCVRADALGGGPIAVLFAAVELPDGARIKQVAFYGEDSYAPADISIQFYRGNVNVPVLLGVNTRAEDLIDSFTTAGVNGVAAVSGADNLNELAGSSSSILTGTNHRFHIVRVQMTNAAATNHVLCGVEVRYQVPATVETGTVFHPISPIRAYDSRNPAYPSSGLLGPNTSRTISIKDGHDGAGLVNALDVVPAGATAITYNITIGAPTGPNFVAVTPGDAASFLASAVNFNGTADIANAGTVAIDAARQIKVWGGDQSGSAHVIIDVTGYYAPPVPFPNMGG
ncbi:MAG TPA: hypothetical protein VFV63_04010 [Ilumatobacteraceae bacterium]|nr:hypothetical protein [Ilumatobacteraceae bacterium]